MRYLMVMEFREIAVIVGISESAVRQHCSRARAHLQALAAGQDEGRISKIMAGLLMVPISDAIMNRVAKEVLTITQITPKDEEMPQVWLRGWKGWVMVGMILTLVAIIIVPLVVQQIHRSSVRVVFNTANPTALMKRRAYIARDFTLAFFQPQPDVNTLNSFFSAYNRWDPREPSWKSLKDENQRLFRKDGPLQQIQIVSVEPYRYAKNCVCVTYLAIFKHSEDMHKNSEQLVLDSHNKIVDMHLSLYLPPDHQNR